MHVSNDDFSEKLVAELKEKILASPKGFLINESEDNGEEYVNFFFCGKHQDLDVLFDAVIYTLRLHHQSELYEIAEHKAAQKFPQFKKIQYEEDENGDLDSLDDLEEEIGLFMAEVMDELEEEESVKVQEHVEIDEYLDHRIGLDIGLNVEEVNAKVISQFIRDFNTGNLKLDKTLYTFETEHE